MHCSDGPVDESAAGDVLITSISLLIAAAEVPSFTHAVWLADRQSNALPLQHMP
jgi:hypothetical protein